MLPDGGQLYMSFQPSDIGIPTHDLYDVPEFEKLRKLRKDRMSLIMENVNRRNELRSQATREALDSGSTSQEASDAGREAWEREQKRWLSS